MRGGCTVSPEGPPDWLPRGIITPASDAERDAVRIAQRALRVDPTGEMDWATRSALRGAQYLYGLPVTGDLDEATARVVEGLRPSCLEDP